MSRLWVEYNGYYVVREDVYFVKGSVEKKVKGMLGVLFTKLEKDFIGIFSYSFEMSLGK